MEPDNTEPQRKPTSSRLTHNQRLLKNEWRIIMGGPLKPCTNAAYRGIRWFRNSVNGLCYPGDLQICNRAIVNFRTLGLHRAILIKEGWIRYNKGIPGKEKRLYEFPLLDGPDEERERLYLLSGLNLIIVKMQLHLTPIQGDLSKENKKEVLSSYNRSEKNTSPDSPLVESRRGGEKILLTVVQREEATDRARKLYEGSVGLAFAEWEGQSEGVKRYWLDQAIEGMNL